MSTKSLTVIAGLAVLSIAGTAPPAAAQTQQPARVHRAGASGVAAHPRIEINPTVALSALQRLVRHPTPAERDSALSANALLVGARVSAAISANSVSTIVTANPEHFGRRRNVPWSS
jgi:hypothetical protein